jgi:hypothetical protein
MAGNQNLFDILRIAPTLDPGAVKRGYFMALQRSPPHADPAGFQRVREAYERLSCSEELYAAFMSTPPNTTLILQELHANIGQEMSRVVDAHARRNSDVSARRAVVDALSRLNLEDALRRFAGEVGAAQPEDA